MKFSQETQAFYADDIEYPNLPVDATEIAESEYASLFGAVNTGRYIYIDNNAPVISGPRPDNYHEWDNSVKEWTLSAQAEQQKKEDDIAAAGQKQSELIDDALRSISVIQLKVQAGRALVEAEKNRLDVVLDYISEVENLDISTAPDINWPVGI